MDETCPAPRRRTARMLFGWGLTLSSIGGCVPPWYLSFAEGEQQRLADRTAGRRERPVFLFYKDHLDPNSGRMMEVLESPSVKPMLADKIRCMLVKDFPPNQRYLAQYEVTAAPALVVVHPDGTYHAREGLLSAEQTRDFLTKAVPPGAPPQGDRAVLYVPEYAWFNMYEDAAKAASRQNRKLFIVYKWWLSGESTELLNRLSTARIRQMLGDTVHCMLDWDYTPNRSFVARYGVTKVPAMIVVHPDGTYHAQVGLPTIDGIVQFISSARPPGRAASFR